jgi:hypothetical protein
VDPISDVGMQTVASKVGVGLGEVGAVSAHVVTASANKGEDVNGMQSSFSMTVAVEPHVHAVSAPCSENTVHANSIPSVDAMDSTGGAVTKLPLLGMGRVRKWKRQARVKLPTGSVIVSGQSTIKKRKIIGGADGQQGAAVGKKSKKSEADSHPTSPVQAEAVQQPRLAL